MQDVQGTFGQCMVQSVTRGSGAKAAGLAPGDTVVSVDGARIQNCDGLLQVVQAHQPGDSVKIAVVRFGRPLTVTADLVSREEILRRRLVGQPVIATELFGTEDGRAIDLSAQRGKTMIVGWFDVDKCTSCAAVFGRLDAWVREHADRSGATISPLAVASKARDQARPHLPIGFAVPFALAEPALYEEFTIPEYERISFLVIDCRGVVQYVAPISPSGDDTDAALDELFAVAEQASRRMVK